MSGELVSAVIRRPGGDAGTDTFRATETGMPGVYRAEVVFPAGGDWDYAAIDPFGVEHGFPSLTLAAAPAAPADGSDLLPTLAATVGGLVALGLFGVLAVRRSAPAVGAG